MKAETKEKIEKKIESPEDKKKTITAFLLMFPSVIIGFMCMLAQSNVGLNFLVIGLLLYQFILLSEFIKDFYKRSI